MPGWASFFQQQRRCPERLAQRAVSIAQSRRPHRVLCRHAGSRGGDRRQEGVGAQGGVKLLTFASEEAVTWLVTFSAASRRKGELTLRPRRSAAALII